VFEQVLSTSRFVGIIVFVLSSFMLFTLRRKKMGGAPIS
jgi:hypothetical protein